MARNARVVVALALLLGGLTAEAPPAVALEEADRLWLVGERALADGLNTLARRMLERLVERFPDDPHAPEATLLLGKARLALQAFAPALEAFRRAQTLSPPPGRPEEARFWEAETLFRMKRFAEARAAYERLLSADAASPLAPDALYGLGFAQIELKQREAAVASFRQLLGAFPEHETAPSAAVQLGRLLVEGKRYAEAERVLDAFVEGHPGHRLLPEARYLVGVARVSSGHVDAGVAELRAVVAAYPSHDVAAQARRVVVDTLMRDGKKADLAQEYKTLMALSPRTAEALYDAGVIATRLGRPRDAEQAWRLLGADFPDHPLAARAGLEQAHAAFARGGYKDAVALARAAAKSPEAITRARALLLVGESELRLKRFAPAHQAFQAAAEAGREDADVRFRALAGSGLALEEQRQWAQAARYYDEVASDCPDKELKQWARARRAAVGANLKPSGKAPSGSGKGTATSKESRP